MYMYIVHMYVYCAHVSGNIYIYKEAPSHSAGPGQGLGLEGPGARGPGKGPEVFILVILGWSGVHFGRFCLPFGRFGMPKGCSGGRRASGKGSDLGGF